MEKLAYILILVSSFLWAVETIPQIIKIIKVKNVKGVSFLYFLFCWIAYCLYIFANLILGNTVIAFSHVPSFVLNMVIMLLIIKYRGVK